MCRREVPSPTVAKSATAPTASAATSDQPMRSSVVEMVVVSDDLEDCEGHRAKADDRRSTTRANVGAPSRPLPYPRERPRSVLGEHRVVILRVPLKQRHVVGRAGVAEGDDRVASQPPRVVAGHEEPVVLVDDRASVGLEPGDQVDVPPADAS